MKWPLIIIGLIIIALVVAVNCGIPALEWIAGFFDVLNMIFNTLASCCRWLQDIIYRFI